MSIAARLWLSAALMLAVLATETIFVHWIVSKSDDIVTERATARVALARARDVVSILVNGETAQRGYVLTGMDRYLQPYQDAVATLPAAMRHLNEATIGFPELRPRIDRLYRTADAKMDELKQTIALRRDQGFEAAMKIVLSDRGRDLMIMARSTAGEIESALQTTIMERDASLRRTHAWLYGGLTVGSLIVAACILLITALILRSLARPLLAMRQGIDRIGAGDLSYEISIRGRDELTSLAKAFNRMTRDLRAERATREQAEIEVTRTDAALKARSEELEQRTQTIDILARMANRMPSCVDEAEFVEVVRRYVPQIFPGVPGALHALSNSQTVLRRIVDWNDPAGSEPEFNPLECWGLRRGQPHVIAEVSKDIVCAHIHADKLAGYRCIPLVAQGETVGLLYLEMSGPGLAVEEQYLQVLTETVASSLVNLRLRERLRNQSIRDPLTGLFNRRYLEESLELEIARADRAKQTLSIAMLDIDHFKRFNDTFGHDAGDVVLKNIGQMLRQTLRTGDVACRYGGEEFLMVLPATSLHEARTVAERVRIATQKLEINHRGHALGKITLSVGIAAYPLVGDTPEAIVNAADQALYRAKESGRDRVEMFGSTSADTDEMTPA